MGYSHILSELNSQKIVSSFLTVSIHCAPEMSEIDCTGRIDSFWPKFVRGGKYFGMFSYS